MVVAVQRHSLAAGRAIILVPQQQQLTTQAAANMLGFSRPHLIKLLESGAIPFQKVGHHRRIMLKDILTFQKKRDVERRAALNELARAEFKEGMYEGTSIPDGSLLSASTEPALVPSAPPIHKPGALNKENVVDFQAPSHGSGRKIV